MMKSYVIFLGVLLCLVVIEARHTIELSENTEDDLKRVNNGGDRAHHRRKRYHINYGYDYQQPPNPFQPYRREYDRGPQQQDLLPEILRLLDEISAYVRRPQPSPPQPIYIPYAIPYPVCNCGGNTNTGGPVQPVNPNITSRLPPMDTNQNWGLVKDDIPEEEGDGSRPLSFTPIRPKRPLSRPPVPFDHGTQSGRVPTTQAPPHVPAMCDVVSLSCCNGSPAQQKQCLTNAGCFDVYDDGRGCNTDRLRRIIEEYSRAYAPVN